MRVAFYAPMKPPGHELPSGDRQMARLLWAALERAGHRVELASPFCSWQGQADAQRQRRLARLGGRLAARVVRRYRGRAPGIRPEAWFTYHVYHKAPDWLGAAVARALAIPYVIAEASHAPKRADGPWAVGHAAATEAIAAADLLIVLNSTDRACVAPLVRSPDRLRALAPFIDARAFREAGRDAGRAAGRDAGESRGHHRREMTKRLGIDPASPVLATVAMMRDGDKLCSYRVLARALRRLRHRPWSVLIAGDGPALDQVRSAFATALGREITRVRFLGRVGRDHLPAVYAAADMCLWPAINEAYGMALLEAQATGTPVVAGRSGGVPDVVDDGRTGLLTAPGDEAAFAAATLRLLDDAPLRKVMGDQAAKHVDARHDLPAAAVALDGMLRALPSRPMAVEVAP